MLENEIACVYSLDQYDGKKIFGDVLGRTILLAHSVHGAGGGRVGSDSRVRSAKLRNCRTVQELKKTPATFKKIHYALQQQQQESLCIPNLWGSSLKLREKSL